MRKLIAAERRNKISDLIRIYVGRGNPKRIMWESDKEVMYNMTDALISPESLSMLLGTEFTRAMKPVHKKETLRLNGDLEVELEKEPADNTDFFVFSSSLGYDIGDPVPDEDMTIDDKVIDFTGSGMVEGDRVIVDYYYLAPVTSMEVKVDGFPGYYFLEAETLWTREDDGALLPAIFTMPRIKFASNFTIENAAAGDPATFDFNAECFPDADNTMVSIDIVDEDMVIE